MHDKKFRAFEDGKMIYHDLTNPPEVSRIVELAWFFKKITDDAILMSFTGRQDKNDKDVYEGDLIRDGSVKYPYLYEVYWDDRYQWSLRHYDTKQFSGSLSNNKYIVPEEMHYEVIGNPYENPELVAKEKVVTNGN